MDALPPWTLTPFRLTLSLPPSVPTALLLTATTIGSRGSTPPPGSAMDVDPALPPSRTNLDMAEVSPPDLPLPYPLV